MRRLPALTTSHIPLRPLASACSRGAVASLIALVGWTTATAEVSVLAPGAGATLRAGETVEVRWTALAADVEEFELLLSLDGGVSFPVRLTPQLDPRTRSLPWLVPNLPCRDARLLVRFGRDGLETETLPSGAFRIEGAADDHPAWLREEGGELRLSALTSGLSPDVDRCPGSVRRPRARPVRAIPALSTHHTRSLATAREPDLPEPVAAKPESPRGVCGTRSHRPTFPPRRE